MSTTTQAPSPDIAAALIRIAEALEKQNELTESLINVADAVYSAILQVRDCL